MEIINTLPYISLLTTFFIYFTYGDGGEKKEEERKPALLEWEDSNKSVLFYPDNISAHDQNDLFYDRIVAISLFEQNPEGTPYTNIALGVLLNGSRILTSFNPFRAMIKDKTKMRKIKFTFMSSRKYYTSNGTAPFQYYGTYTRYIGCARSVIPMVDEEILFEQWHDPDQKHNPLHDLLILKTDYPVRLGDLGNKSIGYDEENRATNIEETGPIVTKVADSNNYIGRELHLVSLGLTAFEPISAYKTLRYAIIDQSDLIDCNFWLPKNWGYFICMKNDPSFIGFASSTMLFSNDTLFGVGSFTIWRGEISVLVFTDVRPYAKLIKNTCTEEDLAILYSAHG